MNRNLHYELLEDRQGNDGELFMTKQEAEDRFPDLKLWQKVGAVIVFGSAGIYQHIRSLFKND